MEITTLGNMEKLEPFKMYYMYLASSMRMTFITELKNAKGLKYLNGLITAKWCCCKAYSADPKTPGFEFWRQPCNLGGTFSIFCNLVSLFKEWETTRKALGGVLGSKQERQGLRFPSHSSHHHCHHSGMFHRQSTVK